MVVLKRPRRERRCNRQPCREVRRPTVPLDAYPRMMHRHYMIELSCSNCDEMRKGQGVQGKECAAMCAAMRDATRHGWPCCTEAGHSLCATHSSSRWVSVGIYSAFIFPNNLTFNREETLQGDSWQARNEYPRAALAARDVDY